MMSAWESDIAKAARGDREALKTLFTHFRPRVRRVLAMFANLDADEVEDLVQDTFIRAFNALPKLHSPAAFEPWLLSTARNQALSRLSRRQAQEAMNRQWEQQSQNAIPPLPESWSVERNSQIVRELIEGLPEGPERTTVTRFYLEGNESARTIAASMGVSKGAITMRLERFRQRVKRELVRRMLEAAVD